MKKVFPVLFCALFAFLSCSTSARRGSDLLQYVDPFVGTAYTGHTHPGAVYPFGMMQPGPQTGNFEWKYCAGYKYEDRQIWGFSQNRLNGTGIPDMGDLLMMPFSGTPGSEYKSTFAKESEIATPGYYSVELIDNAVRVELTVAPHVAMHRYTFEKNNPAVYVNFQSGQVSTEQDYENRIQDIDIQVESERMLSGYYRAKAWIERPLYFVLEFDKPFTDWEEVPTRLEGKAPACVFHFATDEKQLQAKVAFSMVSVENAKENLFVEVPHWRFEQVKEAVECVWEEYLSRVQVKGTEEQKRNFYTSFYHLLTQPNNIADVDSMYRGATEQVARSPFGKYYSTFSTWDTYRAAHPMYTILTPDIVSDMVNSMILHAEVYDGLPIWALWGKETYCMVGNHGVSPVVEACLKNFSIDKERAYQAVKKTLTGHNEKYDWTMYDRYGYFPFDLVKEESVSRTFECGYDDYCAALLAGELGKTDDYSFFMKRAGYYRNLLDPDTKLARGKDTQGRWRVPFDPYHLSHAGTAGGDYTEGNAWQYTWHVQHDVDYLISFMGGREAFVCKLDSLFTLQHRTEQDGFTGDVTGLIGQYAQGNEPSHHVIYLYTLAGRNDRTAELLREVYDKFYLPKPDGLCGNDDCGQMSAWYMFGALGFYPVDPASGEFVIGAPQIPQITINLPAGKTFVMTAHDLSEQNKYVRAVYLNGSAISDYRLTYDQIMSGGKLDFYMTAEK